MSRLGMFACLLMLVALAICAEVPANMKGPEPPKEGGQKLDVPRRDAQVPSRPELPRSDAPRPEGRTGTDLPKGDNPKPDAKGTPEAKS
ncbi:uncharacterized protein LOC124638258 [Helicoverpa zea]|uniref:uncharacterized protein LOC124638258 n=1 Tax=Helicoverpa zea TaxID=7113 RepID=UPI001F55E957|nr:uncharacterized protein LOC124638258 [Helicoverpa zea]